MTQPYYADEHVALYHGDCREVTEWLEADVLVTDPPYGRGWKQGDMRTRAELARGLAPDRHDGIAGDDSTEVRDAALEIWGSDRPAVVFGDLMLHPPASTKLVGVYLKPPNAGTRGAIAGVRRDCEAIYLVGPWPSGLGGRSSLFKTIARSQGNPGSPQGRFGHPHAKPGDVMEQVVLLAPDDTTIADPFAGSGSTLVAAKALGHKAIGVELDERYAEIAARRLSQGVLDLGGVG